MLWPERDQLEFPRYESIGYREVLWNEQLIAHPAILTRLRRQALRHAGGRDQTSASATIQDGVVMMLAASPPLRQARRDLSGRGHLNAVTAWARYLSDALGVCRARQYSVARGCHLMG